MELKEIEKSLIKTYKKDIWCKFTKAINLYNLVEENDKIAVCISGGKDSFILAKCFQELKKHCKFKFELEFIVMNPGFTEDYLNKIIETSKFLNVPIKIFETDIFSVVDKLQHKSNCYVCAKMRRGHLYNIAKNLGCNKIALGHHLDDVIETLFLNMFYNGKFETMLPKLKSKNFLGMELIRPLYLINEKDIIRWQNYNELIFKECSCGFKKDISKRMHMKKIIEKLRKDNKFFDANTLKSTENVNLDSLNGYIKNSIKHNYLDEY